MWGFCDGAQSTARSSLKLNYLLKLVTVTTITISVSCVPHLLPSKDLTEISLYVWPVPVSNKMTEL